MLKLFAAGFSILEAMVALAVISSIGFAIYRLQLAELVASGQILTKQCMAQAANSMANQIYASLNYSGATSTSRSSRNYYAETSYSDHTSVPSTNCSNGSLCTDSQYAAFSLYRWKQSLLNSNLPAANIYALVCRDNSFTPPTIANPNCNGNGGLMVKIAWISRVILAESAILGNSNYLVLAVPQR